MRLFDDWRSVVHVALGAASVLLGVAVPATLVFIAYQVVEPEEPGEKLGDLVEYALGLILGGLARVLYGWAC